MQKLKLHSTDLQQGNVERIRQLFPNCVTEVEDGTTKDINGQEKKKYKYAVDFDLLKQELSDCVVDGPQERYHLDWPGKREALLTANAPIAKTLRPCREESVNFDTTKNLFIEGDNLDALKLLQETYLGKIKMIYIDPPYNTGNDFIYEDDFAEDTEEYLQKSNQKDELGNKLVANTEANGRFHSDWLSMMYSRLKLARSLLMDEGVIFISIDDNEDANLTKICTEIFGENNYIAAFGWEKRTTRENRRVFSFNYERLICIAKSKYHFESVRNLLPLTDDVISRYSNPDNDPRGKWQSVSLNAQGGHATKDQFYSITTPSGRVVNPPPGRCWTVTFNKYKELVADNRVWFGEDGNNIPRRKVFPEESKNGLTPHTFWTAAEVGTNDLAKKDLITLFDGFEFFDTPKPVGLIGRILGIATKENDIVLDFFSGSSTTAHTVMQLNAEDGGNRKFIMVQLSESCDEKSEAYKAGFRTIAEISKERIRRAGKKIIEELTTKNAKDKKRKDDGVLDLFDSDPVNSESSEVTSLPDIGFRVLKIDSSNMNDIYYTPDATSQDLFSAVDNVKFDRTAEDLLFQVLLDWGVDLSLPIVKEILTTKSTDGTEKKKQIEAFFVDGNALAACFDREGGVTEDICKELAKRKPLRVVFRDNGFASDAVKINVEQIFKQLSPETEVRTI